MKIKQYIHLLLLLVSGQLFGQEIKLGVNVSSNIVQHFSFEGESYQPANSFYTYYPSVPGSNVLVNQFKFFNGITFGANARFSRKRLGLVFEPQLKFEINELRFDTPYDNDRMLNRRAFRFPLFVTYHLIKNVNSPYLIGGAMVCFENNFDFQQLETEYYIGSQSAYESNVDFGANHFEGVFYNGRIRTNYMLGIGKKSGKYDTSIRYVATLTPENYLGNIWQLELNIAYYFLSNKDLTRKNYLYEE